jgi:lysophospholipase L1-like esterase
MSWIKGALLVFISSFIALFLSELGLRVFGIDSRTVIEHHSRKVAGLELHDKEHHFCEGPLDRWERHPIVWSREHPNSSYFEYRNRIVSFHEHNKYGFRGPSEVREGQGGVIVLGDSFIRGALADNTETIPAFLDLWTPNHTVFNFGTAGHGTLQHSLTYEEFAETIEHDLVILTVYQNDAKDNQRFLRKLRGTSELDSTSTHTSPAGNEWLSIQKYKDTVKALLQRLKVGQLFLKAYRNTHARLAETSLLGGPHYSLSKEEVELLVASIKTLIKSAHEHRKEIFIVTIPNPEQFSASGSVRREAAVAYGDALHTLVNKIADEEGVLTLDLYPLFRDSFEAATLRYEEVYGFPDNHFTEYGYYIAASEIADVLRKHNIIPLSHTREFINRTHYEPETASCP